RMHVLLSGCDVHAFGSGSVKATAKHVRATGMHGGKVDVGIEVREMGGEDDRFSRDCAPIGFDAAWVFVLDVKGARLFKDEASIAGYFLDERQKIFARVELRLPRK